MKIVVFRYYAGIVTPLFIWYDDYRRPTNGRPRGGLVTKKIKKDAPVRRASERP